MTTFKLILRRGIAGLAIASCAILPARGADTSLAGPDFFEKYPDQLEFPRIMLQPLNQLVPLGSNTTFVVEAGNGPLAYQWLRNGTLIPGATNGSLTIENTTVEDVGVYSCNVIKGLEIVPTRGAQLIVYASRTGKEAGANGDVALASGGGSVTVWATPVTSSGSSGTCPGSYAGYVRYSKTVAQGWGWAPSSGTTNHSATDVNRTDTKVEYDGKLFDVGCDQTTVTVPHPTFSTKYRFTIYFPDDVPTDSYPIVLDGFDP